MQNFATIYGADLIGNDKIAFTPEKYNGVIETCFLSKSFNLGRTQNVGGLGGGSTWGVSDWNFYGHYASYSGWGAIVHELGHCYGYGHDSNMTYANPSGVSWPDCISPLHSYRARHERLPHAHHIGRASGWD